MIPDPYAPHLRQAEEFFARGEIVKAGQIWQAILKQQPTHAVARERLVAVKQRLLALREVEAAAVSAVPPPPAAPAQEPKPPVVPAAMAALDPAVVPAAGLTSAVQPPVAPAPEPVPVPVPEPAPIPREDPPPPPAPKAHAGLLDPDRLVTDGCTLYDMGQIEDALRKWEQVLQLDPDHALARSYANGARREQGLQPLHGTEAPAPVQGVDHAPEVDADKLLREAVQLYDMGLTEVAITKWERILALDPDRHEVESYLKMARAEIDHRSAPVAAPKPASASQPEADSLDLKLRQAEHLLSLQRHEEAAFTFQQALRLSPGDAHALQGLERCRKPGTRARESDSALHSFTPSMAPSSRGRIEMAEEEDRTLVLSENEGVQPPATLLKTAPAPREGLSVPDRLREALNRVPWLKNPKVLVSIGGAVLALIVGFSLFQSHLRDQALKEEVRAARNAAVAPVAQQSQAPNLAEAPAAIREEAETALLGDPLRAYLRAETLVAFNSKDAAAAQLLEKARAGLPGGVTGASLPEFQKHLQNGDLEAALKVMDALLRARPEDADLRTRSGRLQLALCAAHANQAKWDEAHVDLLRGRALFPGDKTWQIRLKLLDHVKTLPKGEQAAWITLLG